MNKKSSAKNYLPEITVDGDNQSSIFDDNFKNEQSCNILNSTEFTQSQRKLKVTNGRDSSIGDEQNTSLFN